MCLKRIANMIIETMGRRRAPITYTKSLLHFEGDVGSTTMTDETGKTWTPYGAYTYISDAVYKFGSASARISAPSGARYIYCSHDDFLYGTDSFTIDFWIYINATFYLFSQGGIAVSGGFGIQSGSGNKLIFWHDNVSTITSITYTYNTLNHIAIIGNGASDGNRNIKVYLNGVLGLTSTYDYNITNTNIYIGANGDYIVSLVYSGYVDEFRCSKGIERWTSDFTPPTSAYTLD